MKILVWHNLPSVGSQVGDVLRLVQKVCVPSGV